MTSIYHLKWQTLIAQEEKPLLISKRNKMALCGDKVLISHIFFTAYFLCKMDFFAVRLRLLHEVTNVTNKLLTYRQRQ